MRRHRTGKPAVEVSLFPFLAVLICTMGTLIILLVVVVRQAKVRAETISHAKAEQVKTAALAEERARRTEQETQQWRFEQLVESRKKTAKRLTEHRLQLSHIEDHTRRIEDELETLQQQEKLVDRSSDKAQRDRDTASEGVDELKRRIRQQREVLEAVKREASARPRSYAIIPYEGHLSTRRRPIYVECTKDSIVLQPEGIVLVSDDFRKPLGPGNPLAAALRATREYLARLGQAGEPYPLLVVRPEGAEAYAAAREAMKSWDAEFGYELVGADIRLEFPPPDPVLGELLRRTVDDARARRHRLALAAPSRFGRADDRRTHLRASPRRGGFVVQGGSGQEDGSRSGFGHGSGPGTDGPGTDRDHGNDGLGTGHPSQDSGFGAGAGHSNSGRGTRDDRGDGGFGAGPGRSDGQVGRRMRDYPDPSGAEHGDSHGPPGATADGNRTGPMSDTSGGVRGGRPGDRSTVDRGGQPGGAWAGASGDRAAGNANASAADVRDVPDLSRTRGRDWALPGAAAGATGITRPVRVICQANRLMILPRPGTGSEALVVQLGDSTKESVDEFVSAIWKHIEGWGIAGPSMYWKPVLNVQVAPGGERRYEHLKQLLHDSGVDVRQAEDEHLPAGRASTLPFPANSRAGSSRHGTEPTAARLRRELR